MNYVTEHTHTQQKGSTLHLTTKTPKWHVLFTWHSTIPVIGYYTQLRYLVFSRWFATAKIDGRGRRRVQGGGGNTPELVWILTVLIEQLTCSWNSDRGRYLGNCDWYLQIDIYFITMMKAQVFILVAVMFFRIGKFNKLSIINPNAKVFFVFICFYPAPIMGLKSRLKKGKFDLKTTTSSL